jgi:hypothetical protein
VVGRLGGRREDAQGHPALGQSTTRARLQSVGESRN